MLHKAHAVNHHGYLNVSSVDTGNNTPEKSVSSVNTDWVPLAGIRCISEDY